MKISQIREMGRDELQRRLGELKETLFTFRFQHGIGQLENSSKIKATRKEIARVYTVLREQERNQ